MALELHIAPYRLLFLHPFGTAHGMRDGTDAVFVRLSRNGVAGYGEATLPPYLSTKASQLVELFKAIDPRTLEEVLQLEFGGTETGMNWASVPPARSALIGAYIDLISRMNGVLIGSKLSINEPQRAQAMVTLGHGDPNQIAEKLSALPTTAILKVKLGGGRDRDTIRKVLELDDRLLFLDANQGWSSVHEAMDVVDLLDPGRVAGIEQPFAAHRWDLHKALQAELNIPVFGDESIQDEEDLARAPGVFRGVNLKLMKCGGLDVAHRMALSAHAAGLHVMLGSMSESTLGSATMAQLGPLADFADLDGPWLLRNDPFQGLEIVNGMMAPEGIAGTGTSLLPGVLEWTPIGT